MDLGTARVTSCALNNRGFESNGCTIKEALFWPEMAWVLVEARRAHKEAKRSTFSKAHNPFAISAEHQKRPTNKHSVLE